MVSLGYKWKKNVVLEVMARGVFIYLFCRTQREWLLSKSYESLLNLSAALKC